MDKFSKDDYVIQKYGLSSKNIWQVIKSNPTSYTLRCIRNKCKLVIVADRLYSVSKRHIDASYCKCSESTVIAKVI